MATLFFSLFYNFFRLHFQDHLWKYLKEGPSTEKFSPCLSSFALSLSFYSPRAYNFVKDTFNQSLSHIRTISKWYQTIDGSPGFIHEALTALKLKQNEAMTQGNIFCNLVFDEMSLRRQIE